jgi:type II secretory pathway pseudopilin PulG
LVEVVVAIALVGIGLSTTIAALTKFNEFASKSRNQTGAYAAAMNQIDAILSVTPFNPPALVPPALALGVQPGVPVTIYADPTDGTVVQGILTATIADVSSGGAIVYRATVTVAWQYLGGGPIWSANRNRWEYQLVMSTLRASD